MSSNIQPGQTRYWFLRCTSCSEALFTVLDRGAGIELDLEEQACHPLSGGMLSQGHACGMMWGSALATGVRARNVFDDADLAAASALLATAYLVNAFTNMFGSVDCRELTQVDLSTLKGKLLYVLTGKPTICTRMSIKWAPEADGLIDEALTDIEPSKTDSASRNCAVDAMRLACDALGLDAKQCGILPAGFAGGLGLSGNACGALAAGIFALGLKYYTDRDQGRDSMTKAMMQEAGLDKSLTRPPAKLRRKFIKSFGTDRCYGLTNQRFKSTGEHSEYVANNGCKELIESVARWTGEL